MLACPIYFIRGNHEDFAWLAQLPIDGDEGTAVADPFDLFRYVPDGTLLQFGELRLAFLGGVEEQTDEATIDRSAYDALMALGGNALDVLVTHEGPYGSSIGFHGDTHGSPLISRLIEQTRAKFHVAGHAHCVSGPRLYGDTLYFGLDILVAPPFWYPDAKGLQAGCLASLDTRTGELQPVTGTWLATFPTPFDFDQWFEGFAA